MVEQGAKARTYSAEHVRRLHAKHIESDGYGRHRHLYLHDTMRNLAASVADGGDKKPTLLDYGCGKGQFMEEMKKLGVFGEIAGYDPGFEAFQTDSDRQFDIVSCLDVLDAAEKRFLDAILADIARRTTRIAVFDCLTKPAPKSGFAPHPPYYWYQLVQTRTEVIAMELHFPGLLGFERAVIIAKPK
jgi:2-polyprenyl-3-methyl-5-hydroxy-6-metoxy-1,4-benzoquinol methylase